MSEELREQLSALMDGELDRDSARFLLRRLDTDPALKSLWDRQHLARAALRRQAVVPVAPDFATRVMAEVAAAPVPKAADRWSGWFRTIAGGAIAASVAVGALFLARPAATPGDAPARAAVASAPATAPRAATVGSADTLMQSRPLLTAQPASATLGGGESTFGVDPRLQSYLIRHYEAAGAAGRGGMAPYVLLVVPSGQDAPGRDAAMPQR